MKAIISESCLAPVRECYRCGAVLMLYGTPVKELLVCMGCYRDLGSLSLRSAYFLNDDAACNYNE